MQKCKIGRTQRRAHDCARFAAGIQHGAERQAIAFSRNRAGQLPGVIKWQGLYLRCEIQWR